MLHALLALLPALVSAQSASVSQYASTPNQVKFVDGELHVHGAPFYVKGICYSPAPIGESLLFPPHGDFFTEGYAYMWMRDLPLIKAMGANTLRIYGWDTVKDVDHIAFLDAVHSFGLKVLLSFDVGKKSDSPPVRTNTVAAQAAVLDSFKQEVARYGDHPAILAWSFGNELNERRNGFMDELNELHQCNWDPLDSGCYNSETMDEACTERTNCLYENFFAWLNAAAVKAQEVTTRPIMSGLADVDRITDTNKVQVVSKLQLYGGFAPDIAAWGFKLYRGKSFENYFESYAKNTEDSQKPFIVTEYGTDAYNDPCGWPENTGACFNTALDGQGGPDRAANGSYHGCSSPNEECARPGSEVQAEWNGLLTDELFRNRASTSLAGPTTAAYGTRTKGTVIGGFLRGWVDELWKGTMPSKASCEQPCSPVELAACSTLPRRNDFATNGTAGCGWKAHVMCPRTESASHGLCGYSVNSASDNYINEEWFGFTTPEACGYVVPEQSQCPSPTPCANPQKYGLDVLVVRPTLLELRGMWSEETQPLVPMTCEQLLPCWQCLRDSVSGSPLGDCLDHCEFGSAANASSTETPTGSMPPSAPSAPSAPSVPATRSPSGVAQPTPSTLGSYTKKAAEGFLCESEPLLSPTVVDLDECGRQCDMEMGCNAMGYWFDEDTYTSKCLLYPSCENPVANEEAAHFGTGALWWNEAGGPTSPPTAPTAPAAVSHAVGPGPGGVVVILFMLFAVIAVALWMAIHHVRSRKQGGESYAAFMEQPTTM